MDKAGLKYYSGLSNIPGQDKIIPRKKTIYGKKDPFGNQFIFLFQFYELQFRAQADNIDKIFIPKDQAVWFKVSSLEVVLYNFFICLHS